MKTVGGGVCVCEGVVNIVACTPLYTPNGWEWKQSEKIFTLFILFK